MKGHRNNYLHLQDQGKLKKGILWPDLLEKLSRQNATWAPGRPGSSTQRKAQQASQVLGSRCPRGHGWGTNKEIKWERPSGLLWSS